MGGGGGHAKTYQVGCRRRRLRQLPALSLTLTGHKSILVAFLYNSFVLEYVCDQPESKSGSARSSNQDCFSLYQGVLEVLARAVLDTLGVGLGSAEGSRRSLDTEWSKSQLPA